MSNALVVMLSKPFSHMPKGQWNAMDAVRYFVRQRVEKQG